MALNRRLSSPYEQDKPWSKKGVNNLDPIQLDNDLEILKGGGGEQTLSLKKKKTDRATVCGVLGRLKAPP